MPANLPPQYKEAEERYRQAKTTPEKILALEEMLAIIPHHKGTDKMIQDNLEIYQCFFFLFRRFWIESQLIIQNV